MKKVLCSSCVSQSIFEQDTIGQCFSNCQICDSSDNLGVYDVREPDFKLLKDNYQCKLIELAAKSAGHTLSWSDDKTMCWLNEVWDGCMNADSPWNPLSDKFDAFCLMTKLKISVIYDHHEKHVNAAYSDWNTSIYVESIVDFTDNIDADTRLAITKCAAKVALKLNAESLK